MTTRNITTLNEGNMPCERITCMWEDNTVTDVTEIGAFVNTTMKLKFLSKAENFPFSIAVCHH
jgi:hypothetical protein